MRNHLLFLAALVTVAACADSTVEPRLEGVNAAATARTTSGCVPTTTVAFTESQLNVMLAVAQPGDVIAVGGTVVVTDAVRPSRGVTLTCAAPGDGIAAAPGYSYFNLIEVIFPDVTVQGLTIATTPAAWPIYVERSVFEVDGVLVNGVNARVVGNTFACGSSGCAFFIGSANTLVADNHFTASGSASGIHMQGFGAYRIDGMRVVGNTIIARSPSGAPSFGAIRPRDGSDVVLRDNDIRGPWSNGIATTMLSGSVFERNGVDGARRYGLFVGSANSAAIQVRGLLARGNALSGTVSALHVNGACGNVFVANQLATAGTTPVFFTASTGANNLLGYNGAVVDNGAADCDGDGGADPNFVSGRTRTGAAPGGTMQDVMPHAGRIHMQ